MNESIIVFGQILHVLSKNGFFAADCETRAAPDAKGFSCWAQFVEMLYCQTANPVHTTAIFYA